MAEDSKRLPAHIEDTVQAMADVHLDHHRQTGALQRWIDRITALLGRPAFTPIVTLLVGLWILVNLALGAAGYRVPDSPSFNYLWGVVSLAALYMTGMILATQRREEELASRRDQLTLELTILTEQKAAKLIELVEKLRLDHPDVADHVDEEAKAMSSPSDPQAVLNAIKITHDIPDGAF